MKYYNPTMKDVYDGEAKNLFTVISTFAGCGGSSSGYRLAGGKVLVVNEFIEPARACYKANFPNTVILPQDIRELSSEDFLKAANLKAGELDIFDGSPPCSSFSVSGTRDKGWGEVKKYSETKQRTDDLFFEYARILKGIQPKVFVAENVYGLTIGKAKEVLGSDQFSLFGEEKDTILETLRDCGYECKCIVLNALNYGVAQSRRRTIFIGKRKDLGDYEYPYPPSQQTMFTVRDAIGDIENKPIEIEEATVPPRYEIYNYMIQMKEGESGDKYHYKGNFFNLIRDCWNKPANTILQSNGSLSIPGVIHPSEQRKYTIRELRRLHSIPDDFILNGSYKQNYERIGRSVPPLMMKAIAQAIYENILKGANNRTT